MRITNKISKEATTKFWDSNPCGLDSESTKVVLKWRGESEPYILKIINSSIVKGKSVLDIGCGQGLEVLRARLCGAAEVVGVDLSKESLKKADQRVKELGLSNIIFKHADAEALPFKSEKFDLVYSIGALHHTPDTFKSIEEARRILKKDGKAIIMLYRKTSPRGWAVLFSRKISKIIDNIYKRDYVIYKHLQKVGHESSSKGTALYELFGCPILKAYSDVEVKNLFKNFARVNIIHFSPGFERFLDILNVKNKSIRRVLFNLDRAADDLLGFYTVIIAEK